MKDFLNRFETIPDLLELDHLTVSGDVTFGKGVSLKVGLPEVCRLFVICRVPRRTADQVVSSTKIAGQLASGSTVAIAKCGKTCYFFTHEVEIALSILRKCDPIDTRTQYDRLFSECHTQWTTDLGKRPVSRQRKNYVQ